MLIATSELLQTAQKHGYAIGAFNVYNLEGVLAVIRAAEAENSPAMLQFHPTVLQYGGFSLVSLCLAAAYHASVPVAVQLDHCAIAADIQAALNAGVQSVLADGSHLPFAENLEFTRQMTALAHQKEAAVEAEIGRISGTEDGLTVSEKEAKMTDPQQAAEFVQETGVDALAVTIGNVHGKYRTEPKLDFDRLETIRRLVPLPLVLHGASGLPAEMIHQAIKLGICKFNVNTEVRQAYLAFWRDYSQQQSCADLLECQKMVTDAMQAVISDKLRLFGSTGKASMYSAARSILNDPTPV